MAALFMAMMIASSAPAAEESKKPAAGENVTLDIKGMT